MRERFNFVQRRRMAGLVRRPRSPADLPGNATHAMQSLKFRARRARLTHDELH